MNMTIICGLEILKKIQGPNALNLFLLDQKLKGIDCNKADEQMVFIAENTTSTVNRFAPLQTHSKPKNSADWITNNIQFFNFLVIQSAPSRNDMNCFKI